MIEASAEFLCGLVEPGVAKNRVERLLERMASGSHLVVRHEQTDLLVTRLSHRHEATLLPARSGGDLVPGRQGSSPRPAACGSAGPESSVDWQGDHDQERKREANRGRRRSCRGRGGNGIRGEAPENAPHD
jgi:hypothetical protein